MSDITIQSLHIYPIKSCAGIDVQEAFVSARGLTVGKVADRRFMVVRPDGNFITQREVEQLAQVKLTLLPGDNGASGQMIVSAEGMRSFVLDPKNVSNETITVTMHEKRAKTAEGIEKAREQAAAHFMNGPGSEWFHDFFRSREIVNSDVRLVYQTDDDIRHARKDFDETGSIVSFADGFQLLVTSIPSLHKLHNTLPGVSIRQFRPNMVVDGDMLPNAENTWLMASYGDVLMRGVKPCDRCKVTGVNQETGIYEGAGVIKALSETSRVMYFHEGIPGRQVPIAGPIFGENLVPAETGPIRAGDKVSVRATKPMPAFLQAA